MPLHHARESWTSPAGLVQTLRELGLAGVVMPGSLAWDSYPRAAGPVNVVPSATNETEGAAATLIAAAALTIPYYLTHFVFASAAAGDFQLRFKLRDTAATIFRTLRAVNERSTGPNAGIQSPAFPPFPVAANLGVQAILATSPGSGPTQQAYVTALQQSKVVIDPSLQTSFSTVGGSVFPAPSGLLAGETDPTIAQAILGTSLNTSTTAWNYGAYVEITPGIPTPCLVTAIWGNIGDSIASVQATLATGLSGGEVDWGTFAWPDAANGAGGTGDPCDCRLSLLPFPFYLPANTRIAGKARSAGTTSVDLRTTLEYVPIPLR